MMVGAGPPCGRSAWPVMSRREFTVTTALFNSPWMTRNVTRNPSPGNRNDFATRTSERSWWGGRYDEHVPGEPGKSRTRLADPPLGRR